MYEAQKAYHKRKYNTDPEYRARHNRNNVRSQNRRRGTPDGFAKAEVRRIRHRCKERGLPFDLSPADVIIPSNCPVLGIPLILGLGNRAHSTPSIDRKVPERGYVRGNIEVISWRANCLKHDCVRGDELRLVADYIDRNAESLE